MNLKPARVSYSKLIVSVNSPAWATEWDIISKKKKKGKTRGWKGKGRGSETASLPHMCRVFGLLLSKPDNKEERGAGSQGHDSHLDAYDSYGVHVCETEINSTQSVIRVR